MKTRSVYGLLALLLFLSLPFQNISAQTKEQKIDDLISRYVDYRLFNGSALVADEGRTVFEKGYGFANMEWNIPNEPDTKFRLGSVTKQFTSMLVMQLVEQGKIKLDAKLTDYLPYYRKDTGDKITIHMLLTHTSGIPSYTNASDFFKTTALNYYSPDDFVKKFCSGDLEFTPGSQLVYNNSGYFILGAIIEHVTGKSYEEMLKQNIFDPLGMKNTGYDHFSTIIPKRAAGYEKSFDGYVNAPYLDMSLPYAAGSLYSTVEDLLIWDKALQTEKLLPKKYMDMIFKPYEKFRGNSFYAYGWQIEKKQMGDKEYAVISHGGGINGFNTINYMIPEKGIYIILLNSAPAASLSEMAEQIVNILSGSEYKYPKKSLADHINDILKEDGIDAALQAFGELKNDTENFNKSEREFNNFGYSLLGKGRTEDAVKIFRLNVQEFPNSANVYDSYGEALLKNGNKEEAIANYKKSLELNPGNDGAKKILKDLGVEITEETVNVPAEILNSYAGKYELAPNFNIVVTVENGNLFTQATGQAKFQAFPKSETVFYLKIAPITIEFEKSADGKVTGFVLTQNGRVMKTKKVE